MRHVGSPSRLPLHVPTTQCIIAIYMDFRENFKRMESWHLRRRGEILQDKYRVCRDAVFRALKEAARDQVDILSITCCYQMLPVDEDTSQIQVQVDEPIDLRCSSSWTLAEANVIVTDGH